MTKDRRFSELIKHPLITALIGALAWPFISGVYKAFADSSDKEATFVQMIRAMKTDLKESDESTFEKDARQFRRTYDEDKVPFRYSFQAEASSGDGDAAAIVGLLSQDIGTYLSECRREITALNADQKRTDYQTQLHDHISPIIDILSSRIQMYRIYRKFSFPFLHILDDVNS